MAGAVAVTHPNVITIHAVDKTEKTPYLVMECIDALSPEENIDRCGHFGLKEILRIGAQVAAAPKADAKADCRRQRRALTEGELILLLERARVRPLAEYGRLTVRKVRADSRRRRDTWYKLPLLLDDLAGAPLFSVPAALRRILDRDLRAAGISQRDQRGIGITPGTPADW
jgi:hypothetical protein